MALGMLCSAEVISSPWMVDGVVVDSGDIVFAIGALAMVVFTLRAIIAVFRFSGATPTRVKCCCSLAGQNLP